MRQDMGIKKKVSKLGRNCFAITKVLKTNREEAVPMPLIISRGFRPNLRSKTHAKADMITLSTSMVNIAT